MKQYLKGRLDGDSRAGVLDEAASSPSSPVFLVLVASEARGPQLPQQVPGERLQMVNLIYYYIFLHHNSQISSDSMSN